eukprot:TRINITY_DN1518_c0_g2_i1.p2 TRINITY_DN1518_c0_g2~~TRINITY_DN1518_c0_g2_i1.p2  ORF type:complete len:183 (+),score=52.39 TRINITY_DN1518_c0_g2_i1:76-624(+)
MCIRDRYMGNIQFIKKYQIMPPKVDPSEVKIIRVKVFGGEPGPASTLAPKLGPLGLNAKKVGEDIIKEGNGAMKGIKCLVELKCQNRAATITIINTSSALLIKELNEKVRVRKKEKIDKHSGNLTLDQVKKVAKIMQDKSMAKDFTGTVKQMLGTCLSLGCTVDGVSPKVISERINSGEIAL